MITFMKVCLLLSLLPYLYILQIEKKVGNSQIVLSGSDFRNFSIINSTKKDSHWSFDITEVSISISLFLVLIFLYKIQVTSIFSEDPDMIQVVKKFSEQIDKQLEKV